MRSEMIERRELTPYKGTKACQSVSIQRLHVTTSLSHKHYLSERSAPMSRKNHALPEEQQVKLVEILNRRLADAIDLQLQSRQAYWKLKGPNFIALRELFDK